MQVILRKNTPVTRESFAILSNLLLWNYDTRINIHFRGLKYTRQVYIQFFQASILCVLVNAGFFIESAHV